MQKFKDLFEAMQAIKERWAVFKENNNFAISSDGRVKNLNTGHILRPFQRKDRETKDGYKAVHIKVDEKRYKNFSVHYLVLLSFVGERPHGFVINHINGVRSDNRLVNLEYCTQSENVKKSFVCGRHSLLGERNTQCKIKESDVLNIIKLHRSGDYTYLQLAKKYKLSVSGVSNIFNGHTWSHITKIKNNNV